MRIAPSAVIGALVLAFALSCSGAEGAAAATLKWQFLQGEKVPANAFSVAAKGHDVVQLCRVKHRRDEEIGVVRDFFCQVGGDGMSRPYSVFFVLMEAEGVAWAPAAKGALPEGALTLNEYREQPLYACRMTYEGATVVGTYRAAERICSGSFLHSELQSDEFEVLVAR